MQTSLREQNASVPSDLEGEFQNFEEISRFLDLSSGAIPRLPGVDVHGFSMPLRGGIGGDHILYIDFNERFDLDSRIRDAEREGRDTVVRQLFSEHAAGSYFPDEAERVLAAHKDDTAEDISVRLRKSKIAKAPQHDDASVVVVKYTP